MTSDFIDFDFRAAIKQKNRFTRAAAKPQGERAIDLVTANLLRQEGSEKSLQNVRLLIVVEGTNYRDYVSDLMAMQIKPEHSAQPLSYTDAQILNSASTWNQKVQEVAIFSCYSETTYSEVCALGIRLMGSGVASEKTLLSKSARKVKQAKKKMLRLLGEFCPTHIVISTPNPDLLSWANRNHIISVALFREWRQPLNRQQQQQQESLLKQLGNSHVKWVGAQGFTACEDMASSCVTSDKLIPWTWTRPSCLSQYPPKYIEEKSNSLHLLYAGTLDGSSNIDDLLVAASDLRQSDRAIALQIVVEEATPPAELDALFERSQQLGITEAIEISLADSVEQLLAQVREADAVVIPGDLAGYAASDEMPVIVQVAMAACTPIVGCDRPYLNNYLSHGINAMIFPTGNAKAMVHRIKRLMSQPQLYAQLSAAGITQQSANGLAAWPDLIERWMYANPKNKQWLKNYVLSSKRAQQPEACIA